MKKHFLAVPQRGRFPVYKSSFAAVLKCSLYTVLLEIEQSQHTCTCCTCMPYGDICSGHYSRRLHVSPAAASHFVHCGTAMQNLWMFHTTHTADWTMIHLLYGQNTHTHTESHFVDIFYEALQSTDGADRKAGYENITRWHSVSVWKGVNIWHKINYNDLTESISICCEVAQTICC